MVNYSTILKVIDEDIRKCGDGTYINKAVLQSLDKFAEKYRDKNKENLAMFKYNGEYAITGIIEGTWNHVKVPIFKLASLNLKNIHITHNHPVPLTDGLHTMLSKNDCKLLLQTNFRGELMIRSISAETPTGGGGRITLIRNNNFSEADKHKFYKATSKMRKSYDAYRDKFYSTINKEEIRLFQEHMGRNPTHGDVEWEEGRFHEEAVKEGIKKMGTLEEHLRKDGVYDALENCNCKLKLE